MTEFSNGCVLPLKGIHKQLSYAWKWEAKNNFDVQLMRNQVKIWVNKGKQTKTYSLFDSCFMFWLPIWICFFPWLLYICSTSFLQLLFSSICVFFNANPTCNVVCISKFDCLVSHLCMYLGLKPLYVSPSVMSPMKTLSNFKYMFFFSGLGIIIFESFFIVL